MVRGAQKQQAREKAAKQAEKQKKAKSQLDARKDAIKLQCNVCKSADKDSLLPKLTPEFIRENYPPHLQLVYVQVFHRHGERTPVSYQLPGHSPERWNFCKEANKFHSEFLKSLKLFTRHPEAPIHSDIAKWQGFMFPKHKRYIPISSPPKPKDDGKNGNGDGASLWREDTCDWGQLTDVGRESLKKTGEFLRDLYVDQLKFMPSNVPEDGSLYIRSTEYTRAIESINMLMKGFYPDINGDSKLKLNVRPKMLDDAHIIYIMPWVAKMMPRAQKRARQKYKDFIDEVHNELVSIKGLGKDIGEQIKRNKVVPYHIIFDTLTAMQAHGYKLHPSLTPDLMVRLGQVTFTDMIFGKDIDPEYAYHQNKPMAQLVARSLLDAVYQQKEQARPKKKGMNSKIVSPEPSSTSKKMSVFSGHDTTIAPLLLTFGDNLTTKGLGPMGISWPPFASTIRIELFRDSSITGEDVKNSTKESAVSEEGTEEIRKLVPRSPDSKYIDKVKKEYFVRVNYLDRVVQVPACQGVGNHHPKMGTEMCTLDAFLKQISTIVPDKKTIEAANREFGDVSNHSGKKEKNAGQESSNISLV
ncbi:hypothetical protein H4219_002181 [Mycoemilia scoparia]|uniref:Uncharacterized protein n=1 Tax=Mycoemilia scoparia TaxID=417184 RepID=A0A9W7ZYF0_9FUNG|nr:hypothetical protein H4219_002181 [Mycoemilia scoparia]